MSPVAESTYMSSGTILSFCTPIDRPRDAGSKELRVVAVRLSTRNQRKETTDRKRSSTTRFWLGCHLRGTWRSAAAAWGWSPRGPWWWCCRRCQRPSRGYKTAGITPTPVHGSPSRPCSQHTPAMRAEALPRSPRWPWLFLPDSHPLRRAASSQWWCASSYPRGFEKWKNSAVLGAASSRMLRSCDKSSRSSTEVTILLRESGTEVRLAGPARVAGVRRCESARMWIFLLKPPYKFKIF